HTKLPTGRDIPFLISGVLGIGASGPIIAKSLMPVPTMIMWRNLLGGLVMLPFALKRKEWQTSAQRNAIKWSAISGVLLALHFICFFLAMRMTSVATGTALTATQPIFAALFIKLSGGHIPRRAWSGMFIAFASVLLITGVDLSMSLRSFQGDLLAVIGGALAALYIIIGSNVQRNISTSTFTTVCYLSCAVTALPVAVIGGFDLIGFSNYEWFLLIALVLTAQIMGHTMFNLTLKRVSPAIVGLVVFFEVPVSAILAYFWLDQTPPAGTIPGIIGLLIGCGFFVVRSKQ
ncbi:MAG: EamA family transporter, partial [Actinobacteria bacterium]|nr:EamA family transporter [Actinomycetota bacterium]